MKSIKVRKAAKLGLGGTINGFLTFGFKVKILMCVNVACDRDILRTYAITSGYISEVNLYILESYYTDVLRLR